MLRIFLVLLIPFHLFSDGWEGIHYSKHFKRNIAYKYVLNGKDIAGHLFVDPLPQPNTYTCGSTNMAMHLGYIHWIELDKFRDFSDSFFLYEQVNTNGFDGLSTDEVKKGFETQLRKYHLKYNLKEKGESSISYTTEKIIKALIDTKRPILIYGNSVNKNGELGTPGYHYLTLKTAMKWKEKYYFLINDTVYNSEACRDSVLKPLPSNTWITEEELENYWQKTGSMIPYFRKHMYLRTW
ncbi:hypothetical protein ThvES_00019010 [Thiovulum sp. ES]|nr:hypothetical protein ThvES_00019010 [Thiovulum sp. ES]